MFQFKAAFNRKKQYRIVISKPEIRHQSEEHKTADEILLHGESVKCNETILKFYMPAFKMHHNEELPWSHPFTHKAFLVHSAYLLQMNAHKGSSMK